MQLDTFDPVQALVRMVMGTMIVLCLVIGSLFAAKKWLPKSVTASTLNGLSGEIGRAHV